MGQAPADAFARALAVAEASDLTVWPASARCVSAASWCYARRHNARKTRQMIQHVESVRGVIRRWRLPGLRFRLRLFCRVAGDDGVLWARCLHLPYPHPALLQQPLGFFSLAARGFHPARHSHWALWAHHRHEPSRASLLIGRASVSCFVRVTGRSSTLLGLKVRPSVAHQSGALWMCGLVDLGLTYRLHADC